MALHVWLYCLSKVCSKSAKGHAGEKENSKERQILVVDLATELSTISVLPLCSLGQV